MAGVRLAGAVVLAFLLQRFPLTAVDALGVFPPVLPALLCVLGMDHGPERGALCGLLGGVLCHLSGVSPWVLALYPLVGGISGAVFHNGGGFWGKWGKAVPVLAGLEVLLALGHCLMGEPLSVALLIAGVECLLALACYPLAALAARVARAGPPGPRRGDRFPA